MLDRRGSREIHMVYSWLCKTDQETTALTANPHNFDDGKRNDDTCVCGAPEHSPEHIQKPNTSWVEALHHASDNPNHQIQIVLMAVVGPKSRSEKPLYWIDK